MMRRLSDEMWRRHANRWSVYTRFAAIPGGILAVWSRVWVGRWALVFMAVVGCWLAVNPFVFRPIDVPRSWVERAVFGERQWLRERHSLPRAERVALNALIGLGVIGIALVAWGLVRLELWLTLLGAGLVVVAQLWMIDRMGRLYAERES